MLLIKGWMFTCSCSYDLLFLCVFFVGNVPFPLKLLRTLVLTRVVYLDPNLKNINLEFGVQLQALFDVFVVWFSYLILGYYVRRFNNQVTT